MLGKPDQDGRYPLSQKEYGVLMTLFGMSVLLDGDALKERLKTIRYGWRDMRLALRLITKLKDEIIDTVPEKKLRAIQTELRNTVCTLKINPVGGSRTTGCVYVDQKAMVALADRAIALDCTFCDKDWKACKRCKLFQDINACFPYDPEPSPVGLCPFAGVDHLELSEDVIT